MTYSQINCFLESAKHKSFTKAAAVMYISQPAVSKQVKLLEEQTGLTLFDRGSVGLELTPAGKIMFDFFSKHLEELEDVVKRARALQARDKDLIKIACLDGWNADMFFPEMRDIITGVFPNAKIQITAKNHVGIIEAVINSEADIGVSHESAVFLRDGLSSCVIAHSNSVFIISANHPLAKKEDLSIEDLKDEPFYCVTTANDEKKAHSTHLAKICNKYGFEPEIVDVASSSEAYLRVQNDHKGVFLTISWDRACTSSLYRTITLDSYQDIIAVWKDDESSPVNGSLAHEFLRNYRNRDSAFFNRLLK